MLLYISRNHYYIRTINLKRTVEINILTCVFSKYFYILLGQKLLFDKLKNQEKNRVNGLIINSISSK